LTQPGRCDVTLVCTLPLPGVGLWQTAGSFASRCADDHARQSGQRFRLATGSILTGHSWCNYCGGGLSPTAYPRGPTFVPRPISVFSQPRHFDVTKVCTLPLPGHGL